MLISAGMPDVSDDVVVDFGLTGNGASYCVSGWSDAEPQETWTLGNESRLLMPAPRHPGTYVLTLKVRPLVSERKLRAQRLNVIVNDVPVASFTIPRRAIRTCLVPWNVIVGRTVLDVRFQLPDAARPADLGLNDDRRQIGIAFASIGLYGDRYEAQQTDGFLTSNEPVPVDMASVAVADQIPLNELMLKFEKSLGRIVNSVWCSVNAKPSRSGCCALPAHRCRRCWKHWRRGSRDWASQEPSASRCRRMAVSIWYAIADTGSATTPG